MSLRGQICERCFGAACDAGFDEWGANQEFVSEKDCRFWAHKKLNSIVLGYRPENAIHLRAVGKYPEGHTEWPCQYGCTPEEHKVYHESMMNSG